MADIKAAFGTSTAITITLASLANNGVRESTAVDNGTNKYIDALLYVAFKLQTGTPGNENAIYVYGYASEDGTNYTDNATGSDAGITLRNPTNLVLIGVINVPASGTGGLTWKAVFSVAKAFGGVLPRKWGIAIRNATNIAGDATGSNHVVTYTGVYYTSA